MVSQRPIMSFRPEAELSLELRDAAKRAHRSVGAEIAYRLERTRDQFRKQHDREQRAATP